MHICIRSLGLCPFSRLVGLTEIPWGREESYNWIVVIEYRFMELVVTEGRQILYERGAQVTVEGEIGRDK